jgi:hypothetical protein
VKILCPGRLAIDQDQPRAILIVSALKPVTPDDADTFW